MSNSNVEPWLSGRHSDIHPAVAAIIYSFEMAEQDLAKWTEGLTTEQLWARPNGLASVAFNLKHIAGSTDRLFTYVRGEQLNESQLAAMKSEMDGSEPRDQLLAAMHETFTRISTEARAIDPATYTDTRGVGRKQLPTTVLGLLIHIAEHNQRHVGQAIVTAKIIRASGANLE